MGLIVQGPLPITLVYLEELCHGVILDYFVPASQCFIVDKSESCTRVWRNENR